jgi:opacity protein-like surface antigen
LKQLAKFTGDYSLPYKVALRSGDRRVRISKDKSMRKYLLTILVLTVPAVSMAQGYGNSRAQTWDFSVGGIYQFSGSSDGEMNSSLDIDSELGLGFNVGYNLNSHLNISADFEFLRPDYTAKLITQPDPNPGNLPPTETTIKHRLSQFNGRLKGTYYLTEGPLVPYVEAGLGWTYIDSNVADSPPQGFCWWHPWWGYICESFVSTFSSTEFTYGGALGLRYELSGQSFIKASYNWWKLDTGSERSDPQLESIRIEYGWRF